MSSTMECVSVGEANPDIAGLGIVIALAVQGGISVILSFWLIARDPLMGNSPLDRYNRQAETSKATIEAAKGLIKGICDAQIFAGTALLIAAFATKDSLTLYHWHVIYDITNFTAISFCAALVHVSYSGINTCKSSEHYVRMTLSCVFAVMHLTFSIFFGRALERWDWDTPGRCYNTRLVSHPGAAHPTVDRIYLGITCCYMQVCLIACLITSFRNYYRDPFRSFDPDGIDEGEPELEWVVMAGALYQYPIHLYMTVALRVSNESLLEGDSENSWGFGQIISLVLVADTLIRCGRAVYDVSRSGSERKPRQVEDGNVGEKQLSPPGKPS
ncbi:hypothetical protein B0T14DRAFT_512456 [Immersiella caudata]|uniref:Uncharacterized protein n=1 Tax=Immersiella caudata TaxID=314043 RepID=A0AA39X4V1_9PEZI|nr:hypothetical protein B0T14DRAFT_512456 [Immersiella caudata]